MPRLKFYPVLPPLPLLFEFLKNTQYTRSPIELFLTAVNSGHPNVHEAFHLPGAALPNEFGNQRKERKRKTTCEEHPPLTTWSSKDSIRLHPLNIRHRSLLRLVVLASFWICFMNLWHLFGYDS